MVKKKGVLCYDREAGRYDIYFENGSYYGGLHCGDCFDVEMNEKPNPPAMLGRIE